MKNTKKTGEKTWKLNYSLWDEKDAEHNPVVVKIIKFQAGTHEDVLKKALKILKRSAKRVRRPKSYYLVNIFPKLLPGEGVIDGREMFRLKSKYESTQKILKLTEENVQKYFVQGIGPKAFEQL